MKAKFTIVGLAMMMLSAALAGCTNNTKDEAPAPAPTTSAMKAPAPSPSKQAPPPAKALPGIAYNQTGTYTMQNAPAFPAFNVTAAWSQLTIEYYLNSTASCYVIGSEPPAGLSTGEAPKITITPPVSSPFSFELPPGPGSCGTTNGVIKHDSAEMANEIGLWTVTVTGRGQNLDLALLVSGE